MSIPVICSGCKAAFRVSDKFAGKTGPCPKCGAKIQVPELAAEVKVHAPEAAGGKDSKGRPAAKPLARVENKWGTIALAIGAGVSLLVIVATWMLGRGGVFASSPWLLVVGLTLISPPLAVLGYLFLRDPDSLKPYDGRTLWIRGSICGLAYVAMWIGFSFVPSDLLKDAYAWLYLAPPFLIFGGLVALSCFDLPYGSAVFHYCFYLAVTMFLRYLAGLEALWHAIT